MNAKTYCAQLLQLFHDTHGAMEYHCSTYQYLPQQQYSERHIHSFTTNAIQFPPDVAPLDTSILSLVMKNGARWHIPMLDASTNNLSLLIDSLQQHFGDYHYVIFHTGRSFHVYFETLITEDAWITFMAEALLMNLPGQDPISDIRWIGHRLHDRMASLRLTSQQPHYLQSPTLIFAKSSFLKM